MTAAGPDPAVPSVPPEDAVPPVDHVPPPGDEGWRRLHPATPLLRGGVVLVAVLVWLIVQLRDVVVTLVLGPVLGADAIPDDPAARWVFTNLGLALGAVALLIVAILIGGWLSWRMHTYRITADVVEEREGIVWRKHRRARLDRIQGVNVERPLLARIFGAARVDVAVAGEDANIKLAYLRSADANALRGDLLAAASRARAAEAVSAAGGAHSSRASGVAGAIGRRIEELTAPELDATLREPDSIVRMDVGRLLGSTALSLLPPLVIIVAAVLLPALLAGQWGTILVVVPIVIGFGAYAVRRITRSLRYSIAATPDGIRIGFGLLSTTNETLPPGRIHAIEVTQPLLWRPFGWWSVRINRASRSTRDGAAGQAATTILPVGDAAEVVRVLELILPGIDLRDGFGRTDLVPAAAGAESASAPPVYATSPKRARVVRWFSWRRNGYALTEDAVLLRKGAIWRTLTVVPFARVQSVGLRSGPVARAMRLRRVSVHTVAGAITATIGALDVDDAEALWRGAETRTLTAMVAAR